MSNANSRRDVEGREDRVRARSERKEDAKGNVQEVAALCGLICGLDGAESRYRRTGCDVSILEKQ